MYKVRFYKDSKGKEPVAEYLEELKRRNDKDSRIRAKKIQDYIRILKTYGTAAGEPFMKKIDAKYNIWELRPSNDRVFFVSYVDDIFVLLHSFTKKTKKTPEKEKEKARREVKDLLERGLKNEQ